MTIQNLIEQDGFSLKKTATTNGGEFSGACPFCGGHDRFRVWPSSNRYWCRGCNQSGDAIQYLREFRKMAFVDAAKLTGRDPAKTATKLQDVQNDRLAWQPVDPIAPPAAWQKRGQNVLARAQDMLWSSAGDQTRAFLRGQKGLQAATIKKAGLGLIPRDLFEPASKWGVSENKNIRLPGGVVIPTFSRNGELVRLRVRRFVPNAQRYEIIAGSDGKTPMVIGAADKAAAVIVESELDGLLLSQEVGDLCAVVALGSAQAKPTTQLHALLCCVPLILISTDTDTAGARAAWTFWPKTYGKKAVRWPVIKGKDQSEAWLNGLDLRQWIIAGMFSTEGRHERFCIKTVDGGLSDSQAMRDILSNE
jgi:DNA primase